jgi:eukaryotic-like serine/threonine-protein kinase
MTPESEKRGDSLSLTAAQRIDEVCVRFEAGWQAGTPPRLEDFLGEAAGAEPQVLLRQLLCVELDWRRRQGDRPSLTEYLARFPDHASLVREVVARRVGRPSPPSTTETQSITGATSAAGGAETVPAVAGYEVGRLLGRGGMGVVYEAVQVRAGRRVALKLLRGGAGAEAEERDRFRREVEAAAGLRHPGIVQVHEVGDHDGVPWFSMELCESGCLADYLRGGPLLPADAAALVEGLARAMHHAHQAGIIHRDLKPANILFSPTGAATAAVPDEVRPALSSLAAKVADFGLARKRDTGGHTQTGVVVGTPPYMAPEQASGRNSELGPACDTYALGAILYECLTGRPPFQAATALDTILLVISEEPVSPRRLNAKVPRDLETVCLKCLQKEPRKRYATALELADDLKRFLAGMPVRARPVGRAERAWRWCRRNPAVASLLAVVALLLVAGTSVAALLAVRAEAEAERARDNERDALAEKDRADREAKEARRQKGEAEKERKNANEAEADAIKETRAARAAERLERRRAHGVGMLLTQAAWEQHQVDRFLQLLEEHRPRKVRDEDFRGFEWFYWKRQFQRGHTTLKGHTDKVLSVAFSADGKRIASGSQDGTVKVWDAHTGKAALTLKGHNGPVYSVAFSADGKRIASGSEDRTVKVWDARTGQKTFTLKGNGNGVTSVAFSADGKRILSASGTVKVWDAETGQEAFSLDINGSSVCFSPDGKRIASGSTNDRARVRNRTRLKKRTTEDSVDPFDFFSNSPDVVIKPVPAVQVWDARTGKPERTLEGHTGDVTSVAFSADGKRIVSGSRDGTVKVWEAQTGQETLTLKGHTDHVLSVSFSADGKRIASGSEDKTLKVWDAQTGQEALTLKGHASEVWSVAFSADGQRIASGSSDRTVRVWGARAGQEALTLKGHTRPVTSVAFSPDGKRIASGSQDKTVKVWDAQTGQKQLTLKGHTRLVSSVAFSADGQRIVSVRADDGTVKVWDAQTGQKTRTFTLTEPPEEVLSVAFSADGKRVVSGTDDGEVTVWDVHTGQKLLSLEERSNWVLSVAFSPDGKHIVSGTDSGVTVWDAHTGQELLSLKGGTDYATSVAFSADGKRIASGSGDIFKPAKPGEVTMWDAQTGQKQLTLKGHTGEVSSVAFSPDGKRIASASGDKTVKVWDAYTGQETLTLKGHTDAVLSVAFSPDGKRLASGSFDQTVKVWDATPLEAEEQQGK